MNATEFGLGESVICHIRHIFRMHPEIESVWLYGSRAKGNYTVGSDIDLTIKGDAVDFSVLSTVSQALYELPIPYTVDLSIFSNINNAALIDHIRRVGQCFYRKEDHNG